MNKLRKGQKKSELGEKNNYDRLTFATSTKIFYDFCKNKKPSVLIEGMKNREIKLTEATNLQNEFLKTII